MSNVFLYIKPKAKQRPKHNTRTRVTYTPSETKKYERDIANLYRQAGGKYYEGLLEVKACFVYRASKKKQIGKYKVTRPDIDNLLKGLLDGLIGTAFRDDGCVAKISATKQWGDEDCIVVSIEEIEERKV